MATAPPTTCFAKAKTVTGPANQATQRYTLTYDYDQTVATHVIQVTDSFGLSSKAAYDFRFGKPTVSQDTNNNTTTTTYDAIGRIATITGPYQQASGFATLRFEYHPEGSAGCAAPGAATCSGSVPFAITRHFDIDALDRPKASGTLDTVLFTDGLKRVLQTKKDATVLEGNSPLDQVIVSGRVVFDEVGRVREQFYPVLEPLGRGGVFNNAFNTQAPPTVTDYDALDRVTQTTLPDASVTTIAYGFGPDRSGANQFETVVTDANVNALLKGSIKSTYRDARELITAVKELTRDAAGALQPIWTSYEYDPLKQITQVTDDQGNVTTITYDLLGRRTAIDNPDTGLTAFEYDLASNLTKKITANLRANAQAIDYLYDFNRLIEVRYPNFPGNNVTYTYGPPGGSEQRRRAHQQGRHPHHDHEPGQLRGQRGAPLRETGRSHLREENRRHLHRPEPSVGVRDNV